MNLQMVQNGEHKTSRKIEAPIVEEKTSEVRHLILNSLFKHLAFYLFFLILFASQNQFLIFCMCRKPRLPKWRQFSLHNCLLSMPRYNSIYSVTKHKKKVIHVFGLNLDKYMYLL